jgi:uncharacterized spore protein YtfJ
MTGGDTVIVPVSRVCLGFLSGGGEYCGKIKDKDHEQQEENRHPFAGTSVAGLNLTPMAFLTINGGVVRVLPAHYNSTLDRIIEMVPETIRELDRIVKEACQCKHQHAQTTENTNKENSESPAQ